RRPPVHQIENGIVAAGDPHLATSTIAIWKVAPRFGAFVAGCGNRKKPPELLAGLCVIGAHETLFFLIAPTAAQSFDDFAVHYERTTRVVVALADFGIPNNLAVPRIECHDAITIREVNLVLINGNATHGDVAAEMVFPNHLSGQPFDRLNDSAGVGKIND